MEPRADPPLVLSHSRWQILGLIDVAAGSPAGLTAGPARVPPILTFITTWNTEIDPNVIREATLRGVLLFQQYVVEDRFSAPNNPLLTLTEPIQLNAPPISGATGITSIAPPWYAAPPSTLTSPIGPPPIVVDNPDPAELYP